MEVLIGCPRGARHHSGPRGHPIAYGGRRDGIVQSLPVSIERGYAVNRRRPANLKQLPTLIRQKPKILIWFRPRLKNHGTDHNYDIPGSSRARTAGLGRGGSQRVFGNEMSGRNRIPVRTRKGNALTKVRFAREAGNYNLSRIISNMDRKTGYVPMLIRSRQGSVEGCEPEEAKDCRVV